VRLLTEVRFWWWRALGTRGHLPRCRSTLVSFVGTVPGATRVGYVCAPGCPVKARDVRAQRLIAMRDRYGR
jgi:hypothetical protein